MGDNKRAYHTWTEERDKQRMTYRDCTLPVLFLKSSDSIEDFRVRDEDVWVTSHPKTGTTWTQEMVWCIGNDLDFERAKTSLSVRFPFLEHKMLLMDMHNADTLPRYVKDSVKFADEMESTRYIKTHLPWQLLPRQIRDNVRRPKIIYVSRDAKDTCVSCYYHERLFDNYPGSFDDFCHLFLENKSFYSPYWDHVVGFWKQRHQTNILFITYEELKRDLAAVIAKTSVFLGKPLNEEQIVRLSEHLSFDEMKTNRAVNYEDLVAAANPNGEGQFMRKGKVGGWREIMSNDMQLRFDSLTKEKFHDSGLYIEA